MRIEAALRRRRPLSLTSLIDVIFLLLIFWMTVARLSEAEVTPPLEVPTIAGEMVELPASGRIVVTVVDDSTLEVRATRISRDSMAEYLSRLDAGAQVVVQADRSLDFGMFRDYLSEFQKAGHASVEIAVRHTDSGDGR